MQPIERVRAALAGRVVDRPPFTAWYHFGLQHATPERVAQAHQEYLDAYGLDWLKVMNDYSYPMPEGLESFRHPDDLARIHPFDVESPAGAGGGHYGPADQLRVVELLQQTVGHRVLLVDTVFNAWYTLRRNIAKGNMQTLMADHGPALERALGVISDNLARYARATLARGAAGIFYAVPATAESVTEEQYKRFMRPFDLAFLEAVRNHGEFHVLHAHGDRVWFERVLDYPVHAISWADRAAGPSLAEARALTSKALVGGINHDTFTDSTADEVRQQVREAAREGGKAFLLAPGCSIPTYSFPEIIRAARNETERLAAAPVS